jgi:hypothetical protein
LISRSPCLIFPSCQVSVCFLCTEFCFPRTTQNILPWYWSVHKKNKSLQPYSRDPRGEKRCIWKFLFGVSGVWPGLLYARFVEITIEVLQNVDKKWA